MITVQELQNKDAEWKSENKIPEGYNEFEFYKFNRQSPISFGSFVSTIYTNIYRLTITMDDANFAQFVSDYTTETIRDAKMYYGLPSWFPEDFFFICYKDCGQPILDIRPEYLWLCDEWLKEEIYDDSER